jgi:hypothetical protein
METTFSCCAGTSTPLDACQLIELLQQAGGEVLDAEGRPLQPDDTAFEERNLLGSVVLRHPALVGDGEDHESGEATISFFARYGLVSLSQGSLPVEEDQVDAMARGQLQLARRLYPLLRPRCAWIDEPGSNQPRSRDVQRKRFRCLFWASFFGSAYVASIGRSFLLAAPGWKAEALEDGGVLYVPCRSFLRWWKEEPADVLEYFQGRFPNVRIYRAVQPA